MADEDGGANPMGGGLGSRAMAGARKVAGRGGQSSWATGKLEFDTGGVQKFTAEVTKAKTAVKGLVDEFARMAKILDSIDDRKLAAIGGVGGAKRPGKYGDEPTWGGQATPPGVGAPGTGPAASAGGRQPGAFRRFFGGQTPEGVVDPTANFMRYQFLAQMAVGTGNRIGNYYAGVQNDFASSEGVSTMAANRAGRFGYDNPFRGQTMRQMQNWQNMQGSTGIEDRVGAFATTMRNFGVGRASGIAGQFANMNLLNPGLGGADPAAQRFGNLLSPQMTNRAAPFGGVAIAPGGVRRNATQSLEQAMRIAAGGRNYWDLTTKQAAATFAPGSMGEANLRYLGFDDEMLTTAANTALAGAQSGKRVPFGDTAGIKAAGLTNEAIDTAQEIEGKKARDRVDIYEGTRKSMLSFDRAVSDFLGGVRSFVEAIGDFGFWGGKGLQGAGALGGGILGGLAGGIGGGLMRGVGRLTSRGAAGAARAAGVQGVARGGLSMLGGAASVAPLVYGAGRDFQERYREEKPNGSWWDEQVAGFKKAFTGDANGASFGGINPNEGIGDAGGPLPGDGRESGLHPKMLEGLRRMFADNPKLRLNSGYRTRAEQTALYARRGSNKYPVAKPGNSRHETGLAADVGPQSELAWVRQNASKYGLSVPMPTKDPVHVEVSGAPQAVPTSAEPAAAAGAGAGGGGGWGGSMGFSLGRAGGLGGGGIGALTSTAGSLLGRTTGIGSVIASGGGERAITEDGGGPGTNNLGSDIGSGGYTGNGAMTPAQIRAVAQAAGLRGSALDTAVAIALAESSGNPRAHNNRGEDSRGLWQINVKSSVRKNVWGDLFNPSINAKAMMDVSNNGTNFRPWTTYAGTTAHGRARSYTQYMGQGDANGIGDANGGGHGATGSGGGTSHVTMGGATRISVGDVNLTVKIDQVSEAEARRLATMVMHAIKDEAELAQIGRN